MSGTVNYDASQKNDDDDDDDDKMRTPVIIDPAMLTIFYYIIINVHHPPPPCREGVHILSSSSSSPPSPFSVLKMLTPPQISLTPLLDVLTSPTQSVDLTHDLLTYKNILLTCKKYFVS